jgi:uncharacterized protein YbaR (Trm112 family)
MLDPDVLALLRCPITHSPLSLSNPQTLGQLNKLIEQRRLVSRLHQAIEIPLDGALLNTDCSWALPIHGGIPNLNPDDALDLSGFDIDNREE